MTATKPLAETVSALLRHEHLENYASADALAESITSEIETTRDLTADDADAIGEQCAEWFAEHADDQPENN
jgi:hypothetical protein